MKALIHIGMPKTGSSSIQEFLYLNREALAARGIRYARYDERLGSQFELAAIGRVDGGLTIDDDPARLVLRLKSPEDDAAYVQAYKAFLDRQMATWTEDLFVASSEHIEPWLHSPRTIKALDTFLRARFESVRYVVYVRAQEEILVSSYSERIKRGETLKLEEHLSRRIRAIDLDRLVRRWEKTVGNKRFDVRLMAPDALVGGDLLSDFCDWMGTPRDGLKTPGKLNTALSRDEIMLRRRLNRWLAVRRRNDGEYNSRYFRVLGWLKRLQKCGDEPLVLTPEQLARVKEYHARSNEALRARRFPDRASLF